MTAFTHHTDAMLEPDKPILSSTALETRDNFHALAEGDAAAPKIATQALVAPTAGGVIVAYLQEAEVTCGVLGFPPLGLNSRASFSQSVGCNALVAGVITVTVDVRGEGQIRFGKGQTVLATHSATAGGYVTHSIDISVAIGDLITIQQHGYSCQWRRLRVHSGTANMAVA